MKGEEVDGFTHQQLAGGYPGDTILGVLLDCFISKLLRHKQRTSGKEAEKHGCLAVLNVATVLLNCNELRGGPRIMGKARAMFATGPNHFYFRMHNMIFPGLIILPLPFLIPSLKLYVLVKDQKKINLTCRML